MIEIRDLVFEYPGPGACRVSLDIVGGSITALVGPNGAGKTTCARCWQRWATLCRQWTIDGLDTREAPRAIHARLGYLPDFSGLYDALSGPALSALCRARPWYRCGRCAGRCRKRRRVGLSDRMERPRAPVAWASPAAGIAQAIVHQPRVLLLDEPAAGLDPQARRDLSQLLLSLKAGGALVVSSHILAELEDYSDRMVIVDHGRIVGGESIALKGGASCASLWPCRASA
jgi:ABC-2 type transport system ATP-binding protein